MAKQDHWVNLAVRLPAVFCLAASLAALGVWATGYDSLHPFLLGYQAMSPRYQLGIAFLAVGALLGPRRLVARRALVGAAGLVALACLGDQLLRLREPILRTAGVVSDISVIESSVGLLLIAIGSALGPTRPRTLSRYLQEGLTLIAGGFTAAGLIERSLDLAAIYDWIGINQLAAPLTLELLLLAITLWYENDGPDEDPRRATADPAASLVRIGTALLVAVSLLAGGTGLISMRRGVESTLRANLLATLKNFGADFEVSVDERLTTSRLIATRPDLIDAVAAVSRAPGDDAARAHLQTVIDAIPDPNILGLRIVDRSGRQIATTGRIGEHQTVIRALDGTGGAQLVWGDQLLLDAPMPLSREGTDLGSIVVEQELPVLDRLEDQAAAFGASGEGIVCALTPGDPNSMECLPNRRHPAPFRAILRQDGHTLPVARGLLGQTGTIDDLDLGGRRQIAGFEPLPRFHIAIGLKVDAFDMFAPVRERVHVALPILIWLITAGSLLLSSRVRPLARLLVERERLAQEHGHALEDSKRKLDDRNRVLDVALNNMAQGLVLYDENHRLRAFNRQYERLMGYPQGFLRPGLSHAAVRRRSAELGGSAVEAGIALLLTLGEAESGRQVVERRLGDGRIIEITHEPLEEGGGVVTFSDVTIARAADEILRGAKEEAEAANRAKSEFLSMMSHEIRTPMNGVLGMLRLLLGTELKPHQWKFANTARASAEALLSILDDILDFSKLEANRLVLEILAFDLDELLDGVIALSRPGAREKGLMLQLDRAPDVPRWIEADGPRLRQILLNLVGNAVKFTEHGSVTLGVTVAAAEAEGLTLAIEVRDTGPGIAAEVLPTLFTRFTQADSSISRKFGGTGLGLAISKQLIELMGGTVTVETAPGRGSAFKLELPCTIAEGPVAAIEPELARPAAVPHHLKILVAEDNPVNQAVVTAMLSPYEHEIEVVEDGEAAIEAVKKQRFDLVFMDIQMPKMDGLAATQAIRELGGEHAELPIVALTAHAMMGQREEYLAAGMSDYLSKPLDPAKLERVLRRWGGKEMPPAESVTEPPPPEVPEAPPAIVDPRRIDELAELIPPGRLAAMLDAFFADADMRLTELASATEARDLAALRRVAHDLAGIAGNYGLAESEHLARQVIAACRIDDTATACAEAERTRAAFHRAEAPLRAAIAAKRPQVLTGASPR
ncbi:MAG TPA: ATP-binding protein [Aliidongia sp.]|nr:ATP-binding protein [Aliidongia sp.]